MSASIPQSQLLAEADENSLAEIFARDPEGWQQQDLETIVASLRVMRAKWEAVDATSGKRERTKSAPKQMSTSASAEDLGL